MTAGIGKAEAETRSVTVRHRPAAPPETSISKKEPAIGDGCQSREVMLRSISRFPVLVCAAIHTLGNEVMRGAKKPPLWLRSATALILGGQQSPRLSKP